MRTTVTTTALLVVALLTGALPAPAAIPTAGTPGLPTVSARYETAPQHDDAAGRDANADDPAIWVDPAAGHARSVVVGTLKAGGLTVTDLTGRTLQDLAAPAAPGPGLAAGRFNNVDVLQGVRIGSRTYDVAVTTDRGRDQLRVYRIDPRGAATPGGAVLTDVTTATPPLLFSDSRYQVEDQRTGYGLALRPDPRGGAPWAVVTRRGETRLGLFQLALDRAGTVTYTRGATVDLPGELRLPDGTVWSPCEDPGDGPQAEGTVVDTRTDVVYTAQEDVGIWQVPLTARGFGTPQLVEKVIGFGAPATYDPGTEECATTGPNPGVGGTHLAADAEGLTIAYTASSATLLASSQGDSTFSTYDLGRGRGTAPRFTASFAIGDGTGAGGTAVDGDQHSDGSAVVTTPLGPDFPRGLLVVQDGVNDPVDLDADGEPREGTNFKLVSWGDVLDATR